MARYWVSWWTGNYADEGCTEPSFEHWVTGQKHREDYGMTEEQLTALEQIYDEDEYDKFIDKHARDDCSICAIIDAEDEDVVWKLVSKHFPDYKQRFCEIKADDYAAGSRFR